MRTAPAPAPARTRARVAVLASGGGSNLQAIVEHLDARGDDRAADVALVVGSRPEIGALARATSRGIPAVALGDAGESLDALLDAHGIDLVVLAGWLRLVPAAVTRRFHGRLLNVHPALLPAFGGHGMYGLRVHRAVVAAGVRVSGATVHFVDEEYDRGAIVAQWPVPVFAGDAPEDVAARVLRVEHALYPRVVDAVAAGRVSLAPDGTVRGAFDIPLHARDAAFTMADDRALIAAQIDDALRDGR